MRTFLIIVLIVGVAGVFLNEVGRYARAKYDLSYATDDIVDQLSHYARPTRRETRQRPRPPGSRRRTVLRSTNTIRTPWVYGYGHA